MKVTCDVLQYFLNKNGWSYELFHYDPGIEVDIIRHYHSGCKREAALYLLDANEPLPAELGRKCILLLAVPKNVPFDASKRNTGSVMSPLFLIRTGRTALLYNTVHDIFATIHSHGQAMEHIVAASQSYQDLIDCFDDLSEEPFSLMDKNFAYVAFSYEKSERLGYINERIENGHLSNYIIAQLVSTPGFEKLEEKTGVFEFEDDNYFIGRNIFHEGSYVGRLIIMHTPDAAQNQYRKYLLEHLAGYIERMYQRKGTFYLYRQKSRTFHTFLQAALNGQPPKNNLWKAEFTALGWAQTDTYSLATFAATYRHEKQIYPNYLCPQFENMWAHVIAVPFEETAVLLINWSRSQPDFERQFAHFIRENLLTAGISRRFSDFARADSAYRQAQLAMEIGLTVHPHLWYYYFDNYALDYVRRQCTADLPADAVCHPALNILLGYDEQHGTQLYQSLHTFLDTRYNMSESAARMFVHRTTFIKRIEQIEKLTGIDLADYSTRVYLLLSYDLLEN